MPIISDGGGGGGASTVYLTHAANIDIHAAGIVSVTWTAAFDNAVDSDALPSVPAALGLTIDLTGATAPLVTRVPGIWAYEFGLILVTGADASLKAGFGLQLQPSSVAFAPTAGSPVQLNGAVGVSGVFAMGFVNDSISFKIQTTAAAAANPYNVTASVTLVRLG